MGSKKKKRLPDGYTQIKYVYCDGSQPYVKLETYATESEELIVWAKVSRDTDYEKESAFAGCAGISGSGEFEMYYMTGATKKFSCWPSSSTTSIEAILGDEFDEYKINLHRKSGGVRLVGRFRANNYKHQGKIFEYAEWAVDNTPIHHLYPCISPNNVVGFYCTVADKFYGPETSSVFIAGPAV